MKANLILIFGTSSGRKQSYFGVPGSIRVCVSSVPLEKLLTKLLKDGNFSSL